MEKNDRKICIGIIRGGKGENYFKSLEDGHILISQIENFLSHKYKIIDILVDQEGLWYINGLPIKIAELPYKVDIIWDTTLPSSSQILKNLSMPVVAVPFFAHTMSKSKKMLRDHMQNMGIQIPNSIVLPLYQKDIDGDKERYIHKKAQEVFEKFPSPWIVKSLTYNKDMGIHVAKTFPELMHSIEDGVNHATSMIVEEFIDGKMGGLHTVRDFRGEELYNLPPLEIRNNKISSTVTFSHFEKEKLRHIAREICRHLGVEDYLHFNFVISKNRGIYITNISFLPSCQEDSHLASSCLLVGTHHAHILDHILQRACAGRFY